MLLYRQLRVNEGKINIFGLAEIKRSIKGTETLVLQGKRTDYGSKASDCEGI